MLVIERSALKNTISRGHSQLRSKRCEWGWLPDIIVGERQHGSYAPTTVTILINQGAANTLAVNFRLLRTYAVRVAIYYIPFDYASRHERGDTSGSVSISIDGSPVASIPVNGLNLTIPMRIIQLSVGVHTIVAAYSGDKKLSPGTFTVQYQIAPVIYPTSTALTATPSQVLASRTVRFSATVTSPGQNVNAPNTLSGTVVFRDGNDQLGNCDA